MGENNQLELTSPSKGRKAGSRVPPPHNNVVKGLNFGASTANNAANDEGDSSGHLLERGAGRRSLDFQEDSSASDDGPPSRRREERKRGGGETGGRHRRQRANGGKGAGAVVPIDDAETMTGVARNQ